MSIGINQIILNMLSDFMESEDYVRLRMMEEYVYNISLNVSDEPLLAEYGIKNIFMMVDDRAYESFNTHKILEFNLSVTSKFLTKVYDFDDIIRNTGDIYFESTFDFVISVDEYEECKSGKCNYINGFIYENHLSDEELGLLEWNTSRVYLVENYEEATDLRSFRIKEPLDIQICIDSRDSIDYMKSIVLLLTEEMHHHYTIEFIGSFEVPTYFDIKNNESFKCLYEGLREAGVMVSIFGLGVTKKSLSNYSDVFNLIDNDWVML